MRSVQLSVSWFAPSTTMRPASWPSRTVPAADNDYAAATRFAGRFLAFCPVRLAISSS